MFPCPHCGDDTISFWQKFRAVKYPFLGRVYCRSCGGEIQVSRQDVLQRLPLFLVLTALLILVLVSLGIPSFLVGAVVAYLCVSVRFIWQVKLEGK